MATSSINWKRPWADDDGDHNNRFQPVHSSAYDSCDAPQSPRAHSPPQQMLGDYHGSRNGGSKTQARLLREGNPSAYHAVDKASRKNSGDYSSPSLQATANKRQCLEGLASYENWPTKPALPQTTPAEGLGRRAETCVLPALTKIDTNAWAGLTESQKSGYSCQRSQGSSVDSTLTEQGPAPSVMRSNTAEQTGPGVESEEMKNCTKCKRVNQVAPQIAYGLQTLHHQLKLALTNDKVPEVQSGVSHLPKLDK